MARAGYLAAVPGVGMVVTPARHWPDDAGHSYRARAAHQAC